MQFFFLLQLLAFNTVLVVFAQMAVESFLTQNHFLHKRKAYGIWNRYTDLFTLKNKQDWRQTRYYVSIYVETQYHIVELKVEEKRKHILTETRGQINIKTDNK